ncbi:MAG TPA: LysR family transcriptional regulator [Stenotrophomonas sp.]|nr:LysR family transcriptional regulator [Stenotrophomonas sp.]
MLPLESLNGLVTFVTTARSGSFTEAADALGISRSAVGKAIARLETRLGVRLFHRTTRQQSLTDAGQAYYDRCVRALTELYDAEAELDSGRRSPQGRLRVSAPLVFGRHCVAPVLRDLAAQHPQLQIDISFNDRVVDLIEEGYDLGIRIGGAIEPSFVAVRLASNRRVVCASPEYLHRNGMPKTLDDLAQHNCLAFNLQGGQQRGWYFQQNGKPVIVKVQGNLDCNDGELLHRWAGEGLGLAWRSTWEIQAQLASGELVTVLDDYALPHYDIMAVYPQQRHLPAKTRFFIDYLKEVYAQPDYWNRAAAKP